MSSGTIDVGIDLGTSNSSVAVAVDGEVDVVRNNENAEITPSVVRFLANQSVQVGRKAYEHHVLDPDDNSFSRFKRRMGIQDSKLVPAIGKNIIPEELAAELLKSLRADAEGYLGHPVSAAVITVPAMFELVQSEATQRAAVLAGISYAPLLQEPIAAGLAYGYDRDVAEGYYLVFDVGGGTFDATVVRIKDGQLSVVGTDGDNFLGGTDWDKKLATWVSERLVEAGFDLWEDDDPEGKEFRNRLLLIVEDTKIGLSRQQKREVHLDGLMLDASGRPINHIVAVTREDYEHLITGDIERFVKIIDRLLEQYHVPATSVMKMLMIGAPTYTPLLRRMVPALTGIEIETRIDPMTVVARGAARFAAGLPLPTTASDHFVTAGLTRLSLAYPASTGDDIAHVGGRVEDVSANGYSIEIRRSDGGWASGRVPMQGNAFMTTVELLPKRASTFRISCLDAQGRTVPVTPDSFTIAHGLMVAEPPLSRSITVAFLASEDVVGGRKLLERGVSLPATGRATFRSATDVNPGDPTDVLNVHVYEGDLEPVDLNRHVGFVQITGTGLERVLPENTPIEVTIKVDFSRRLEVRVYVPLLDQTFKEVLSKSVLLQEDPEEVREQLERDQARAEKLADVAPNEVRSIRDEANEIEEDLRLAEGGDEERVLRADRRRKELAAEISRLMTNYKVRLLANEIERFLVYTGHVSDDCAAPDQVQRLTQLRGEADQAIAGGDSAQMERVRDDIIELYWAIVWECPSWWVGRFLYLSDQVQQARLTRAVEPLLIRGQAAVQAENLPELRLVCDRLNKALPRTHIDSEQYIDPRDVGLR